MELGPLIKEKAVKMSVNSDERKLIVSVTDGFLEPEDAGTTIKDCSGIILTCGLYSLLASHWLQW